MQRPEGTKARSKDRRRPEEVKGAQRRPKAIRSEEDPKKVRRRPEEDPKKVRRRPEEGPKLVRRRDRKSVV